MPDDDLSLDALLAELNADFERERERVVRLTDELQQQRMIGMAIGLLMARHQVDDQTGADLLAQRARAEDRSVHAAAVQIVAARVPVAEC